MIELELKYKVEELPELACSFEKKETVHMSDIYYDSKKFDLIHQGIFIRERGKGIDIKYLISSQDNCVCNEFNVKNREFNMDNVQLVQILKLLGLKFSGDSFEEFLKENELIILLAINKTRTEYKRDNITICFDEVEKLGKYIEIEAVFEELNDFSTAKSKLKELIKETIIFNGNYKEEQTGYVELYLKEFNPAAYERCLFKGE